MLALPLALKGAATRPGRRAVVGLLLVLLLAAAILGSRVAMARGAATPHPVASGGAPSGLVARSVPSAFAGASGTSAEAAGAPAAVTGTAGPVSASAPASATGAAASTSGPGAQAVAGAGAQPGSPSPAELVVDVVGQVRRPGVVHLSTGARVLDAVAAAGGALRSAQTSAVNLARPVVDGEQILIPKPGQSAGSGAAIPQSGSAGSGPVAAAAAVVDLNSADATALNSLPGVGPVLAQRILDWRGQHGRFSTVDELGEVSGIGDKLLAQIGPHVRI